MPIIGSPETPRAMRELAKASRVIESLRDSTCSIIIQGSRDSFVNGTIQGRPVY